MVTGAVVDAFVISATVQAFPVSAVGVVSGTCIPSTPATSPASCATATTDGSGNYTINLGDYSGAVLLAATGGSYTDPVTGQTVQLPNDLTLSVLLPSVAPGAAPVTAQITPLTTLAAELALQVASQGTALATAVQAANMSGQAYFGGLQSLDTTPLLDLTKANCAAGASQESEDMSLVLAGISKLASQNNVSAASLALAIIEDASDGNLDGALNGTPQSIAQLTGGGSVSLATIYSSGLAQSLEASIVAFEQSAADVCQVQQSASLNSGLSNPPSSQLTSSEYSYSVQGTLSGFSGNSPVAVTYALSFSCPVDTAAPPALTFDLSGNGSFSQSIGGTASSYANINYSNSCGSNQWTLSVQNPPGLTCTVSPATGTFSSSDGGNTNNAQGSPAISCTAAVGASSYIAVANAASAAASANYSIGIYNLGTFGSGQSAQTPLATVNAGSALSSVVIDSTGNLYYLRSTGASPGVTDTFYACAESSQWQPCSQAGSTLTSPGQANVPMAIDSAGNAYAALSSTGQVVKFAASAGPTASPTIVYLSKSVSPNFTGLAVTSDGTSLYVVEGTGSNVAGVGPSGEAYLCNTACQTAAASSSSQQTDITGRLSLTAPLAGAVSVTSSGVLYLGLMNPWGNSSSPSNTLPIAAICAPTASTYACTYENVTFPAVAGDLNPFQQALALATDSSGNGYVSVSLNGFGSSISSVPTFYEFTSAGTLVTCGGKSPCPIDPQPSATAIAVGPH